jgi:mediator of RNA polymerase II transcription subunit 12
VLPEILLLADQPNPDAPSILANSLWYKYRTSHEWGWKVWDNTVASLRQIPVMTSDMAGRQSCALRYGTFLLQVDQHLPGGLDHPILQWLLGPGKSEVVALSTDAWDILTVVLLYLCVHGALATTTILRGLVYPAWELAAAALPPGQSLQSWEVFLCAANNLFEVLLLREDGNAGSVPPRDLLDIQRIRTRRQDVYRESHFSLLVASIPTLVIIEKNEHVSDDLRRSAMSLRCELCETREFRQAAYRNLDGVRDAFEQTLQSGVGENLGESMIDALRLVLSESQKCTHFFSWML